MIERIWIYEARVVKAVDGDTTLMDIDQGRNVWARNTYVRYAGINAPEMHGAEAEAGEAALEHLMSLIEVGQKVWLAEIEYHETEKYGRDLAVVYTEAPASLLWAGANLEALMPGSVNQAMIDSGHAVPYNPTNL